MRLRGREGHATANDSMRSGPPSDPLVTAFDRVLKDRPDHTILLSSKGSITASQLDSLANHLEQTHLKYQTSPGVIGLAAGNGPAFLAALLCLRRCGHTVLLLDPQSPRTTLARLVTRFSGRLLLFESDSGAVDSVPCTGAQSEPWLGGFIKLSSGSTGDPQGVATPTAALLEDDKALRRSMGIRPSDRFLAMVPFSHSYGLSSLVVPALADGLQLVVPEGATPFSALQAAERFEATVLPTVPAFLTALVRAGIKPPLAESLRLIVSAGAPLPPETAEAFESLYGLPIHVFYGSSESGGITYDRSGTSGKRGTVGTPVDGVSIWIDNRVEDGFGRVVVESEAVADCYLPAESDDLLGGVFHTSDLGEWVGDEIRLRGRLGELINVRGRKVHPREVQEVITSMEEVDEAIVSGSPAGNSVVAVVASRRSTAVTESAIVAWCRERLAPFKVPRRVVLVPEIPRNARGKVDRDRIRRLLSTAPDPARRSS